MDYSNLISINSQVPNPIYVNLLAASNRAGSYNLCHWSETYAVIKQAAQDLSSKVKVSTFSITSC